MIHRIVFSGFDDDGNIKIGNPHLVDSLTFITEHKDKIISISENRVKLANGYHREIIIYYTT